MSKSNTRLSVLASLALLAAGPSGAAASGDPGGGSGRLQTAVFAGGCFWGVDAVFRHVKGVVTVETDRRFNRMRPSIAPRKRHQAG